MSSISSNSSLLSSVPDVEHLRQVLDDTHGFEDHRRLVLGLQKVPDTDLEELKKARDDFFQNFALPASIWQDWLEDECRLADGMQDRSDGILNLFEKAIEDCPVPSICLMRFNFIKSLPPGSSQLAMLADACQEAIWFGAAAHFHEGELLWNVYLEFLPQGQSPPDPPPFSSHSSDATDGCRIFETRLQALPKDATEEEQVAIYMSYATYVAEFSIASACSVYERCLERWRHNFDVWEAYHKFCISHHDDDRGFYVARRATRTISKDLRVWTFFITSIPNVSLRFVSDPSVDFTHAVGNAKGPALSCISYRQRATFTKVVWTVFMQLGAPAHAYDIVRSTQNFSEEGTVDWASATSHIAAVQLAGGRYEECVKLFERVVESRASEPRWWLAYASCLRKDYPDEARSVLERSLKYFGYGPSLHVLEDAFLSLEIEQGKDQVVSRVIGVIDSTKKQETEVGGAIYDGGLSGMVDGDDNGTGHGQRRTKRRRPDGKNIAKRRRHNEGKKPMETVKVDDAMTGVEDSEAVRACENDTVSKADVDMKDGETDRESATTTRNTQQKKSGGGKANKNEVNRLPPKTVFKVEPKTIYVNNLAFRAAEKDIQEFFSFAGMITDIRLPRRSDGVTKGFAYVEFESNDCVDKALTKHDCALFGRTLYVRRSQLRPRKEKGEPSESRGGRSSGHGSRPGLKFAIAMKKDQDMTEKADGLDTDKIDDKKEQPKTQADFRAMLLPKREGA